MPIQCLYIAGERLKNGMPLWHKVEKAARGQLKFFRQQPTTFEEQILIVENKKPDLLVIELRLDEKKGITYKGPTLAQELRSRMAENRLPSFPIVLWSFSNKLKQIIDLDGTICSLFDRIYLKDKEIINEPQRVAFEFQALVKGYQWIIENRTASKLKFYRMLDLGNEEAETMDPLIGQRFVTNTKKYSIYEYAKYILEEMIDIQGPLINEFVLAARLGIDIQKSKDWSKCKDLISQVSAYTGAFCDAWPRWWNFKVDMWWASQPHCPAALISLEAKERVEFLRSITGLNRLVVAQPIQEEYSTCYMTICQGFNKPLDPVNGVWAEFEELKSWQEPPFLSLKAAFEKIGEKKGINIHPLMAHRLEELIALRGQ